MRLLLRIAKGIPVEDKVTLVIPSGLRESFRESSSSNSSSEQELELELELERGEALDVSVNAAKEFIEQAVEFMKEKASEPAPNSVNDPDKKEELKQSVLEIKNLSTEFVTMIEGLGSSFFQNPMLEDP